MDLNDLRKEIDRLDQIILEAFLARLDCAAQVADYKEKHQLPILNRQRELEILEDVRQKSGERGPWAEQFYESLFALSKDFQAQRLRRLE